MNDYFDIILHHVFWYLYIIYRMSVIKDKAVFVKHLAWLLEQERHIDSCYWAKDVSMVVDVIVDVSNNEDVTFDVDKLSFLTPPLNMTVTVNANFHLRI